MIFLKVKWLHQNPTDPVVLFSELDPDRYEVRKVEVFADGRKGYASAEESFGGTILGELPIPPSEEIAQDCQFEVMKTTALEFESIWIEATSKR
jgi:hypothetical protein